MLQIFVLMLFSIYAFSQELRKIMVVLTIEYYFYGINFIYILYIRLVQHQKGRISPQNESQPTSCLYSWYKILLLPVFTV